MTFSFEKKLPEITETDFEPHVWKHQTETGRFQLSVIRRIIKTAKQTIAPVAITKIFDCKISLDSAEIDINGRTFCCGNAIIEQIEHAKQVVCYLITLGDAFDNWKEATNRNNAIEAYFIDIYGSLLVERLLQTVRFFFIEQKKRRHQFVSPAFYPGNCGWHISDVQQIISLLSLQNNKVSITQSGMMRPVKSVCGLFAIGNTPFSQTNTCQLCTQKSCPFRKYFH